MNSRTRRTVSASSNPRLKPLPFCSQNRRNADVAGMTSQSPNRHLEGNGGRLLRVERNVLLELRHGQDKKLYTPYALGVHNRPTQTSARGFVAFVCFRACLVFPLCPPYPSRKGTVVKASYAPARDNMQTNCLYTRCTPSYRTLSGIIPPPAGLFWDQSVRPAYEVRGPSLSVPHSESASTTLLTEGHFLLSPPLDLSAQFLFLLHTPEIRAAAAEGRQTQYRFT